MSSPVKGQADYLAIGDWNAVCYECGHTRKASELRKHWKGYWVCPEHWEPREAQDFVKNIPDGHLPPWVQPQPAITPVGYCTPNGLTGIADWGTADCAVCEYVSPMFDPTVSY